MLRRAYLWVMIQRATRSGCAVDVIADVKFSLALRSGRVKHPTDARAPRGRRGRCEWLAARARKATAAHRRRRRADCPDPGGRTHRSAPRSRGERRMPDG